MNFMSTLHKGKNPLRKKAFTAFGATVVLYSLPILITVYLITRSLDYLVTIHEKRLLLPLFFMIVLSILGARHFHKRYNIIKAGLSGERLTLDLVRDLPFRFHIFNSLVLSIGGRKREIDMLFVGTKGVFVMEVKNYRGSIVGSGDENNWQQTKTSKAGETYRNHIPNPVKQVKAQGDILTKYLRKRGIEVNIRELVFFSNPDCDLNIRNSPIPVFKNKEQLVQYFKEQGGTELTHYQVKKIIREMENLSL